MMIAPDGYLHVTGKHIMMVCQICMLQVSILWWYAKFVCYSCWIEWHWLVPFESRFFAFLLSALYFWVFIHVHISLAVVVLIICHSFLCKWLLNSRLELWPTCLSIWSKHVLFTTEKLVSKYLLLWSIRCHHFNILCDKNA